MWDTCWHIHQDRVTSCFVKVQKVAAVIGCRGNYAKKLHIRPKDSLKKQSNLVFIANTQIRNCCLFPSRQFGFKSWQVGFQHSQRNCNNCCICIKCLPILCCYSHPMEPPIHLCHSVQDRIIYWCEFSSNLVLFSTAGHSTLMQWDIKLSCLLE